MELMHSPTNWRKVPLVGFLMLSMVVAYAAVSSFIPGFGNVANAVYPCTHYVATTGSDSNAGTSDTAPFLTVQHALNVATAAGSTICVRTGTFAAGVSFPASGTNKTTGRITLQNYPGESPILSGLSVPGNGILVDINNKSFVRLSGFEITDWTATARSNSGGILVRGSGTGIEVLDNKVHNLQSNDGNTRPIAIWGTSETVAMTDVRVAGNEIFDTWQIDSEALQVSGNVDGFEVSNNSVHDTDGALYQVGGGLMPGTWACSNVQARNGLLKGNVGYEQVWDRETNLVGIYLDGVKNVKVDSNVIHDTAYGIFVSFEEYCTEQSGAVVNEAITIQNNLVYGNRTAGVWVGTPYDSSGALIVNGAKVLNNTIFQNGTNWERNFGIGNANNVDVYNNIFGDSDRYAIRYLGAPYTNINIDYNLYWSYVSHHPETPTVAAAAAKFEYGGTNYTGFAAYKTATGQDQHSLFLRPDFEKSMLGNFQLASGSAGVNAGSSLAGQYAALALDGTARPQGSAPDMGAYER